MEDEPASAPIAQARHYRLIAQRTRVSGGTAIAKAIDYGLNGWNALTRFLDDSTVPIDNNHD